VTKSDEPQLVDSLREALRAETAKIRTCIPGRVVSYDHSEQRADVRPVVRSARKDPDTDERVTYLPDVIPNCPVSFPQGGGFSLTWPLQKGDRVELRFASRSLDEWLTGGGDDVEPKDPRRFDVTDAIVDPGISSFAEALANDRLDDAAMVLFGEKIYLGDANPAQFVALAGKVEDEIQKIRDKLDALVSAYNGHTHTSTATFMPQSTNNGGQTVVTNQATNQATGPGTVGSVASDKVKAD